MKHERGTTRKGEVERTKHRQTLNDSLLGGASRVPLRWRFGRGSELTGDK